MPRTITAQVHHTGVTLPTNFEQSRTYRTAFVLTEQLVRDMTTLINENSASTTDPANLDDRFQFTIKMVNDSAIRTGDVEDVLRLANHKDARITSLSGTTGYRFEPKVSLTFARSDYGFTISYTVAGSQVASSFIASQLEEIIKRSKPWYNKIATTDSVAVLLNFMLGLCVLASILGVVVRLNQDAASAAKLESETTVDSVLTVLNWIGFAALALIGLGYLLNKLRAWVFPIAIFAIGDGVQLVSRLAWWRGLLGVAVIVAALVNIATGLLI